MSDMSFTWKGVSSDTHGVIVTRLPPITIPALRSEAITIPGRPGAVHIQDGAWDEMVMMIEIYLPYAQNAEVSAPSAISAWLQGDGWLTLSDAPGRKFHGRITDAISLTPLVPGFDDLIGSIGFWCEPFQYDADNEAVTLTAPGNINNTGTVYAEPVITVTGSGDIMLAVGGQAMILSSVDGSIVIDGAAKCAYKGTTLLNHKVSGEWPKLAVGLNAITWSGTVTSVAVTPNLRWI